MQVTGNKNSNNNNTILSIRVSPSGLCYFVMKGGKIGIANRMEILPSAGVDGIVTALGNDTVFNQKHDIVNIVIDSCDMILVPDDMVDDEFAVDALMLSSIDITDSDVVVVTEMVLGVRAICKVDKAVFDVLKQAFPTAKFYASIHSDIMIESDSIRITANDESTSMCCRVGGKLVYANIIPSNYEVNTLVYYIQSIVKLCGQMKGVGIYISGSRCSELLEPLREMVTITPSESYGNICSSDIEINVYMDLIRLSNANN